MENLPNYFNSYKIHFQAISVIRLACWVLMIPQFFCATIICPPPDFPEGGSYEPKQTEYEEGFTITYSCNYESSMFVKDNWIGLSKLATCISGGKWSETTPFCDTPAKIKLTNTTLSFEEHSKVFTNDRSISVIISGDACFRIQNGTEEFLEYSLGRKTVVYSTAACWWHGRSTFNIKVSETLNRTFNEYFGFEIAGCWFSNYNNKDQETEYINVQVSPDKSSTILLCAILVFAKTDEWCENVPENSVPNSQLEVGRSKAVLHCNEGFREKYGREVYATCKNNTWSFNSLECVGENEKFCDSLIGNVSLEGGEWDNERNTSEYEVGAERKLKCRPGYHKEGTPLTVTCHEDGTWTGTTAACKIDKSQRDYKILGIVGGSLVAIIIIILIGVIFFITRKKHSTSSSIEGQNITSLSET